MKHYLYLLAFALLFTACGGTSNKDVAPSTQESTLEETNVITTPSGLSISPSEASQEFPDAKLESFTYRNGFFTYNIDSKTYKLGAQTPDAEQKVCANSAKGQHIHLIINDNPYVAKYNAGFEYDVEDGEHYVLSFLSRSYHESIKSPGASSASKLTIKNKSIVKAGSIDSPMLFYSRPKGTYVGKDTKKIMLDFFLVKTGLGEYGYRVKADINGETVFFDKWQPYFIEGLPMGENKITLSLVDSQDNLVVTPYNPVTRVFTLMDEKPGTN